MAQPLLDLGDVGLVLQGVGRGGGPQGVRAEAGEVDPGLPGVALDDRVVDRIRVERLVQLARGVVLDRPEEGTVQVLAMAGRLQVIEN